jgi:hypothetical protein
MVSDYLVRFSAVSADTLPPEAGERLVGVLDSMPGVGPVDGAAQDSESRRVSASFTIDVEHGMADAARDGSRLAKEALNAAGMPDAQLVRLAIVLWDDRLAEDSP